MINIRKIKYPQKAYWLGTTTIRLSNNDNIYLEPY